MIPTGNAQAARRGSRIASFPVQQHIDAALGAQIHGGMGFIEETGAAQCYRDARILPVYEGTNGIQSIDLVTRKLPLEGGKVVAAYIAGIDATVADVKASNQSAFRRMAERIGEAVAALKEATVWLGGALGLTEHASLKWRTVPSEPVLRARGRGRTTIASRSPASC